jgi:hypothetical protein
VRRWTEDYRLERMLGIGSGIWNLGVRVKVKLKIEGYGGVDRFRTEEYVWNRRDSV